MHHHPDLVFDIGMHKGEDSAFYLAKGFRVVGFEANPDLVKHCRERFERDIADERLIVVAGAIAPRGSGGKISFFINKKLSVWSTISPKWAARNEELNSDNVMIEIDTVDISDAFRSYGIPFFVKIDIEGADQIVLDAIRLLPAPPEYLSIESEKVSFRKLKEETRLLYDLGYRRFKPVQQNTVPGRTVNTRTLSGGTAKFTFEEDASGPFGDEAPGPWLSMGQCLRAYIPIFVLYRLFGDGAFVHKTPKGRHITRWIEGKLGRRLPGWYDTHAKR